MITLEPSNEPGAAWVASNPELASFYSYFDRRIVAVTFSYQAIEAYSDQVVKHSLAGTHQVKRKKDRELDRCGD
jgi:hypothetical protein